MHVDVPVESLRDPVSKLQYVSIAAIKKCDIYTNMYICNIYNS